METATKDLSSELLEVAKTHLKFLEPGQTLNFETNLAEAGLDSMASINFLLDIEEELGVSIPDELIEEDSFTTLGNVHQLVLRAQAA